MKKLILCLMTALMFVCVGFALTGCDNECKHEYVSINITDATCINDGQKSVVCNDCGYVFPVENIPALGHDFGEAEVIEATCTLPKLKVRQCSRCNEIEEEKLGDPLGHDYQKDSETPATCTEPEMVNYKCSRCDSVKSEPKDGGQKATGHNYEHKSEGDVTATCTMAGEEYYECTHCGDHYSVGVQPPLGHDFDAGESVTASCDHMGYDKYVCKRCNYEENRNIVSNTPHDFDEKGICSNCKKKATESFALTCGDSEIYKITLSDNIYTVYAPSYKWWNKLVMPKEVVQALYAQGVYSFNIKLGSNADDEMKTLYIKVQGGEPIGKNVFSQQLLDFDKCTFANEKGVFDLYKDGISFEVYYCVMGEADEKVGKPKVTCFAISFEYDVSDIPQFTDDVYAYTEPYYKVIDFTEETSTTITENDTITYTFKSVPNASFNRFYFTDSYIAEKIAAGYTDVSFVVSTWGNKDAFLYENETQVGHVLTGGNDGFDCGVIPLTENAYYYIRLYHNLTTGDVPSADIEIVVKFMKPVYAYKETGSVSIDFTSVTSTSMIENDTITYTFKSVENGTFNRFYFNKSYIAEKIAAGYTDVSFVVSTWGNKDAFLYENETQVGHVLTGGNDGFDCGVIPLTENAYYYIRLYHNLPTGAAEPSNIDVIVKFMKDEAAILSDSDSWGYHYHGAATGVSANNGIISVSTTKTQSDFRGFTLKPSAIQALYDLGYGTLSFTITSPSGYIDIYNMADPASCIVETPIYINKTEYYYASGTTITLNLVNLVSDTALMTGEGLKFVVTSTAGWTAYDQDCTVTFSDIELKKPEIPWNDSIKLKIATTTSDFGGSSGNLANDKAKLDSLHAAGFKYVDLSMYTFTAGCDYMQDDWEDKIAELKAYADSLGMTFVQAHSQGGNALDESQYATLVAYTLRQIEICEKLGIENIVVHPGFKAGYTKQQWFEANKVFFDALLVKATECGVNVLCENSTSKNLGDKYWANSGADMKEFIEYVNNPYFHACWDTGHGNCEGPQYDDILALGDELYAIHFNDNLGNGDFHLIPYYGSLDCDIVIKALNNIGYTGYFTFECDGGNRTNVCWHGPDDLPILSENDPSDLTREQQETLLYEIGEYLLKKYDMFDE